MNITGVTKDVLTPWADPSEMHGGELKIVEDGFREKIQKLADTTISAHASSDLYETAHSFGEKFLFICNKHFFITRKQIKEMSHEDIAKLECLVYEKTRSICKRDITILFCLLPTVIGFIFYGAGLLFGGMDHGSVRQYQEMRKKLQKICGDAWFPYEVIKK